MRLAGAGSIVLGSWLAVTLGGGWLIAQRYPAFVQTKVYVPLVVVLAVLLAAGAKGKRFSLPNSRIVIHQPLMQGLAGQATDIDIHAREILRMRERLNEILVHHTGQTFKRIQEDTERDYIMSADQGKEYGIIDDVIRKRV